MRISVNEKVTTIEATAEELRQSNTLADAVSRMLRECFNGVSDDTEDSE